MSLHIIVHNDLSGPDHAANYNYEVRINDDVISTGRITNHNRRDGWQTLLRKLAWMEEHATATPGITV